MSTFSSNKVHDKGLEYIKNVDRIVLTNSEPSSYSDANSLPGSGGSKVASISMSSSDYNIIDNGDDRRIIVPERGYIAQITDQINHIALLYQSNNELVFYTNHTNSNGNPINISKNEAGNVKEFFLEFTSFSKV
jgi:hypothetical protein